MKFEVRVPSQSRVGVWYTLSVDGEGVECTCPGFGFTGHCWHTDALMGLMRTLVEGPPKKREAV